MKNNTVIEAFKGAEDAKLATGSYMDSRYIGTLLTLEYQHATLATCDLYQQAVGGLPQGGFVAIFPVRYRAGETVYFILGRIESVCSTPLEQENLQTVFELTKRANPEVDDLTRTDLSWASRRIKLLGTFYSRDGSVCFAGDVANISSPQNYRVYAPSGDLLDLIVNGLSQGNRYSIGNYRPTECLFSDAQASIPVYTYIEDLIGRRTVAFGQTRCGKSSAIKSMAQATIDTYQDGNVSQVIFDANGEYANKNPQDNNSCFREYNSSACEVFAVTQRAGTPSKPLRLNVYTSPEQALPIIQSLSAKSGKQTSTYFQSVLNINVLSFAELRALSAGSERLHALRVVQLLWCAFYKAGFPCDEAALQAAHLGAGRNPSSFNPGFNKDLRAAMYGSTVPPAPSTMSQMIAEWDKLCAFRQQDSSNKALLNKQNTSIFNADELALITFLSNNGTRAGCTLFRPFLSFHSPNAGDYLSDILAAVDCGKTVILDLANAPKNLRNFFSEQICQAVFAHQESLFANNALGNHYVQIYFEEAHNLLPSSATDLDNIYAKIYKEGSKFNIGSCMTTQSPNSISPALLSQCENFIVTHLASQIEADALAKISAAFDGLQPFLLNCRTPGLMLMLTLSQRYAVPVQFRAYKDLLLEKGGN